MTRKKRAAPEPPIFTGLEKIDYDNSSSSFRNKPKPSTKSRPAPPPPLPRKMLSAQTVTTTATITISPDKHNHNIHAADEKSSDHRPNICSKKKKSGSSTRHIIRRDYFSDDEDDLDNLSFDLSTSTQTSKTPNSASRACFSSGRDSPNESICTTDSGVNSDLEFVKNRHFDNRHFSSRSSKTASETSPTNSIVSQDSLEQSMSPSVDLDTVDTIEECLTPPVAPPPLSDYLSETPPMLVTGTRRQSQLDLIQEARRMLRKGMSSIPDRSPSPTETISSEWSDESQMVLFHINEMDDIPPNPIFDEDFAGVRVLSRSEPCSSSSTSTIRSHRGTIRGVKNRVRAGIATFLRDQQAKNLIERESGKVIVYITTLGIIRETYARCIKVRQILRTLLIRVEERDLFMSKENQQELIERSGTRTPALPQVFVDGQFLGDADMIEKLNECGELRQILKPYKSLSVTSVCQRCGGFRMLPCPSCNGSKKSVHRSDLLQNFIALRCTHCNEAALVKCTEC